MDKLSKIINLVQKTGDKIVVVDTAGNPAYVLMGFDDYEKIVLGHSEIKDLTEEELLAKINRDISLWKVNQETEILPSLSEEKVEVKEESKVTEISSLDEEDKYYIEPVEN